MTTVLGRSWKMIAAVAIACGFIALVWAWGQRPVYEASTSLLVSSGTAEGAAAPYENALGSEKRATSYAKLVYSDAILVPAVKAAGAEFTTETAKSAVSATVVPETALLTVAARSTDPRLAARLADAVAYSMMDEVGNLERAPGSANPTSRLTVLSPSIVNPRPVFPTTVVNVVLSVAFGAIVGVGIALLRERRNHRVRDAADVVAITGARPIAVVPDDAGLATADGGVLSFAAPPNDATNAFRDVRNHVYRASADHGLRTIAVVGCRARVGTTTVTTNLAAVLAESGKSVVIIDANYVNAEVSRRVNGTAQPDLLDLARQPHLRTSLDPRSAGGNQPHVVGLGLDTETTSGDILCSKLVGDAIQFLEDEFDYVLVDTIAIADDPNTAALFQWVDGAILATDTGASTVSDLDYAVRHVEVSRARLIGTVLNMRRLRHVDRTPRRRGASPAATHVVQPDDDPTHRIPDPALEGNRLAHSPPATR